MLEELLARSTWQNLPPLAQNIGPHWRHTTHHLRIGHLCPLPIHYNCHWMQCRLCSGMFNSGINVVTQLLVLKHKLSNTPEQVKRYGIHATRKAHGIRWQVPWGKHTHAKYQKEHLTEKARSIREETGLPVITVRHHVPSTPVLCQMWTSWQDLSALSEQASGDDGVKRQVWGQSSWPPLVS